jgi:hypothetical protein
LENPRRRRRRRTRQKTRKKNSQPKNVSLYTPTSIFRSKASPSHFAGSITGNGRRNRMIERSKKKEVARERRKHQVLSVGAA